MSIINVVEEHWYFPIEQRFRDAFQTHLPCATCSAAHGKETMCPEGGALYRTMLDELDAAIAKRKAERGEAP